MKCRFSETQYSFSFTYELISRYRIRRVPFFPTLFAEGRIYGYDVRISHNTFFQFKVPEYFNKRNQGKRLYWNHFGHDYYKIKLNTNSKQFKLLKALRNRNPMNKVFYGTPEFYTQKKFARHYLNRTIEVNSAIFPVDNLPNYGSGFHHLIYHPSRSYGVCFSSPQEIKKVSLRRLEKNSDENNSKITMFDSAKEIYGLLKQGEYKLYGDLDFNEEKPNDYIREILTVLYTNFNIKWYPQPIQIKKIT